MGVTDSIVPSLRLETRSARVKWGDPIAVIDFRELPSQDLLVTPGFGDIWTARAPTRADVFAIENGVGLKLKPKNGTNWTAGGGSWDAPYVSALVKDALGRSFSRYDCLSIRLGLTLDSEAVYVAGPITDVQLSYGKSAIAVQQYRSEVRAFVNTTYGGGAVRTWNASQTANNVPAPYYASFSRGLELQVLSGLVRSFRAADFIEEPGAGTIIPDGDGSLTETEAEYALEKRDPGDARQYDPETDVLTLSAYNFSSGTKTVIFQQLALCLIEVSEAVVPA